MTSGESHAKLHHGVWITLLMLYVLFFTAGMGFYTHQVYVPRLEEAFGWSRFQTVGPTALWAVVYGLSGFFVGTWIQRLWIFALTHGLGIAGSTVVLPILVGRCFGDLEFGKIQGLVMAGFAFGVIFGSPSAAWIYDQTGSYQLAFILCSICGVVAGVLVLLVRPNKLSAGSPLS